MTLPDLINGLFESLGGVLLLQNCRVIYKDKGYQGVSLAATGLFTLWGYWNMWFYPYLHQWLSFTGGLIIVMANTAWVAMALYYGKKTSS